MENDEATRGARQRRPPDGLVVRCRQLRRGLPPRPRGGIARDEARCRAGRVSDEAAEEWRSAVRPGDGPHAPVRQVCVNQSQPQTDGRGAGGASGGVLGKEEGVVLGADLGGSGMLRGGERDRRVGHGTAVGTPTSRSHVPQKYQDVSRQSNPPLKRRVSETRNAMDVGQVSSSAAVTAQGQRWMRRVLPLASSPSRSPA